MLPARISRKSDKADKGKRSPAHPFARIQVLADPVQFKTWIGSWDECWLWDGPVNERGYGTYSIGGGKVSAHRASYMLFKGPICGGLHVLHKCDVRNCVNPDHLRLGTHAENMADMIAKGRHVSPGGEAAGAVKLTAAQAREVLTSHETGPVLARRFGVTKGAIYAIKNGKTWKGLAHASS